MSIISSNINSIKALCRKYNVKSMSVFGSVLTDRFNADSDVDILVSFDKSSILDYFTNFFDLKYALQDLFGRDVDLVEEETVKNVYFKNSVDSANVVIYG